MQQKFNLFYRFVCFLTEHFLFMFDHALNYLSHLTVSYQDIKSMAPVNSDLRSFCQDGTQIFRSYLRDGIKHCPDASDEIGFAPPLLTDTKIQDRYEEVLKRLESVEEKSTWTMLVEFLDRALPILNSLILFTCGGKKVHSRFKKQRARGQASPQVPAPVPSLI